MLKHLFFIFHPLWLLTALGKSAAAGELGCGGSCEPRWRLERSWMLLGWILASPRQTRASSEARGERSGC